MAPTKLQKDLAKSKRQAAEAVAQRLQAKPQSDAQMEDRIRQNRIKKERLQTGPSVGVAGFSTALGNREMAANPDSGRKSAPPGLNLPTTPRNTDQDWELLSHTPRTWERFKARFRPQNPRTTEFDPVLRECKETRSPQRTNFWTIQHKGMHMEPQRGRGPNEPRVLKHLGE